MDFNPAKKELNRALRCIERMKQAKSYDEYDEAWSDFLSRIENVFSRVKLAAGNHAKYIGFSSKVNHLRSTDELLIYLKQARNTAHHGIADTSRFIAGGLGINPFTPGGSVHIKNMTIDRQGNVTFTPGGPVEVVTHPSTIEAVSCSNRGMKYDPPANHLGQKILSKSPITLAELGCKFYQDYLFSAEQTFKPK
ncbi:hypothetical protein [Enterobacter kobei]|uniref:Uncharacterized protein n=2 Tax=Enterobacter kobei TaxID=208224 RepID=A0ACC8SCV3_9ENTR|nr:hypothetical protein [Enterobacter kobei]OLR21350.1 hypothetical protein BH713_12150 [Enterobacter kobei]BCU55284.1 hypothetical protein ENKO_18780 [Enterobacter kobei]SIQ90680.1 hypothetical protein SAMN05444841_102433 [Enterobacter kobei]